MILNESTVINHAEKERSYHGVNCTNLVIGTVRNAKKKKKKAEASLVNCSICEETKKKPGAVRLSMG